MKLRVTVYENREYVGKLEVIMGDKVVKKFDVSAKSDPNGGLPNPPVGNYFLLEAKDVPSEASAAYGDWMLFFERDPGQAYVKPNCKGKFVLSLHGGCGEHGGLSVTDGGLKVQDSVIAYLTQLLSPITNKDSVELEIVEKKVGIWKRLFGSKLSKRRIPLIRPYKGRVTGIYGDYYYDNDDFPYWLMMYYLWDEDYYGDDTVVDGGYVDQNVVDTPDFSEPDPVDTAVTVDAYFQEPVHQVEPDVIPEPEPPVMVDPYAGEQTQEQGDWQHSNLGEDDRPAVSGYVSIVAEEPATQQVFEHNDLGSEESAPVSSGFTHSDLGEDTNTGGGFTSSDLGDNDTTYESTNGVGY